MYKTFSASVVSFGLLADVLVLDADAKNILIHAVYIYKCSFKMDKPHMACVREVHTGLETIWGITFD